MIGRKFWVLAACALMGVTMLANLGGCPVQVPAGSTDPVLSTSPSSGGGNPTVVAGEVVEADPEPNSPTQPSGTGSTSQTPAAGGDGSGSPPNPAALVVSPESIDFGALSALSVFTLQYRGEGTLAYEIRSEVAWAIPSPAAGVLGAQPIAITVRVDRSGLEPGSYAGALEIRGAGVTPRRVAIQMQVLEPPALQFAPTVLDFGSETRVLNLSLWNGGSGTLTYTVTPQEDWITVQPGAGELATESDTIEVTIHRGPLTVGPHEGHLLIVASSGTDVAVPVTLEKPLTNPLLIPWVDANVADEAEIEQVVAGMQIWQRVTDRVVVTTGYGKAYLFGELRARMPDMRVIPSIKTSWWLSPDFGSPTAWQSLAEHVQLFLAGSGESQIIFEHETALLPYWRGEREINFEQLAVGLSYLPPNVEYGWFPGMAYTHNFVDPLTKSVALAQVVQQVLSTDGRRVRFVDLSYADPTWPEYPPALVARQTLESLANQTPLTIAWFGCWTRCYWTADRIHVVMGQVLPRPDLLVYPGSARWVSTATAIADELSEP